jgi:hypothetical protein
MKCMRLVGASLGHTDNRNPRCARSSQRHRKPRIVRSQIPGARVSVIADNAEPRTGPGRGGRVGRVGPEFRPVVVARHVDLHALVGKAAQVLTPTRSAAHGVCRTLSAGRLSRRYCVSSTRTARAIRISPPRPSIPELLSRRAAPCRSCSCSAQAGRLAGRLAVVSPAARRGARAMRFWTSRSRRADAACSVADTSTCERAVVPLAGRPACRRADVAAQLLCQEGAGRRQARPRGGRGRRRGRLGGRLASAARQGRQGDAACA